MSAGRDGTRKCMQVTSPVVFTIRWARSMSMDLRGTFFASINIREFQRASQRGMISWRLREASSVEG